MAAAVTYQIKGKYDNKAVKSAQTDLTSLAKSLKGLGIAAWAKIGTTAVKSLTSVISGSTKTFNSQNQAARLLDETVKKSNKDFNLLLKNQDKLSKNNFFDSDTLNNAQTMAINMGLNQKQILAVMEAAEDLASTGIMPLDQAVEQLSKTYSGSSGQLGKMYPQIKDLTTAQLKHGRAVEIVAKQYKGMADNMAKSYSGIDTQFKNNVSDLQAAVGGYLSDFKALAESKINPVLNNITGWLVDNRDYIVSFILNLPEIAKNAITLVKDIFVKTFTGGTISNILIALIKTINTMILDTFTYIGTLIDNFAVIIVSVIADTAKAITDKLGKAFTNVSNGFDNSLLDGLASYAKKVFEIASYLVNPKKLLAKGITGIVTSIENAKHTTPDENGDGDNNDEITKKYFKIIAENTTDFGKTFAENLKALGEDVTSNFTEEIDSFKTNTKSLINNDLPTVLKEARGEEVTTENGLVTSNKAYSVFGDIGILEFITKGLKDTFTTIKENITDWWKTTNNSDELDAISKITSLLNGVVSPIIDYISTLENVTALLQPWQTILDAMYEVTAPIVNEVLAPLVGMLKTIGSTMGYILIPLIQALEPVITLLSDAFVWLYNKIIVPVGNGIITVFVGVKNCMAKIINAIISVLNKLPGVDLDQIALANAENYKLSTIDTSTVASAGTASTSSSSTSASSYTAARDIYVNINFDHSFVNGDATEIAIMLKNEIANVEKLGY